MEGAGGRQEELEEDDPDLASALAASLEEPLIQLSGSLVSSGRRSSEDDLQEALRRSLLESGSEQEQEGQEKQVEKREESDGSSSGARAVSLTAAETELSTEAPASPSVFHDAREELSPDSGVEPEKNKLSGITEEGAGGGADVPVTPTREPVPSVDDFDSMCSEEEPSLKQRLSQTILIEDSPAAAGAASDTVTIDDSFGVAGSSTVLIEDSPAPSRSAAEAAEDERARRKAAALEDSFEEQEPRCNTPEEEYAPDTDSEGEGGSKQVRLNFLLVLP